MKHFTLFNETWRFPIFVIISEDLQAAHKLAQKKLGEMPEPTNTCEAHCWLNYDLKSAVIWLRPKVKASVIAHEALHVVAMALERSGLGKLSNETDEAYCYLLEWVVENINRNMK